MKAADLDCVILIAFHGNSGFMNALQCYVLCTLPVPLDSKELTKGITCHSFYCFYCYNLVFFCEKTVFFEGSILIFKMVLSQLYSCSCVNP